MQTVVPAFPARRVLSLHQKRPTPLRVSRVTPPKSDLRDVVRMPQHVVHLAGQAGVLQ